MWEHVVERLEAEEMPPEESTPATQARASTRGHCLDHRASRSGGARNAGDPGPVLARRLSNAEFDYTIRDLTGVDIRPTREFPVDPANEAGFDNSGESLAMSPALVRKYLAAARLVADHLVLLSRTDSLRSRSRGHRHRPRQVLRPEDRQLLPAARGRLRRLLPGGLALPAPREARQAAGPLCRLRRGGRAQPWYLATIWSVLTEPGPEAGPLAELRRSWRKLPSDPSQRTEARRDCERMRDLVLRARKAIPPRVETMRVKGISNGSQPFVLWNNRQLAEQRMKYPGGGKDDDKPALERFCRVFPDTFFVTDRAPYFDPKAAPSGRLLTAGFHLMQGYFRDDAPLCELVLDEAGRRELDALWYALDFAASIAMRQYHDFIFFERAEPPRFMQEARFDFARVEDKDVTSEAKMTRLRTAFVEKARKVGANDRAVGAIEDYFATMSARIRRVEKDRKAAEPRHLEALVRFAERAYRRPLRRESVTTCWGSTGSPANVTGSATRTRFATRSPVILLSPRFCFRIDASQGGESISPLTDHALASRLSYFLWSSMPDAELLAHAIAGDLHRPDVLVAQARRMLRDDRARGLATEFGGNWLDFRRFEEHNGVDRERFTAFTNELRQAMYEEPIRFFLDVVRRDASVLEFLDADHTFVNPILAKHYGIPLDGVKAGEWTRMDDVRRYGRGGLLPMSVFLTSNSPGLRTSPVKRGYWVVRRMLGEIIPPPPPGVPELPKDEAKLGELTLPQLLARHRDVKECAGCHKRFDSIGLAFEGYGPVGERRERDLGGHPVVARVTFPDGSEGSGLDGLRRYISERRREDFVENLCRKLLAYALGRSLLPLGPIDPRGDAGAALRRRSPVRGPGRVDRHESAISQQTWFVVRCPGQ